MLSIKMRPAVLLLLAFTLTANWTDTSTGIDLNTLPRFPLKQLHSGLLKAGATFQFDGITAQADDTGAHLNGIGRSGKKWRVHTHLLEDIWRGDLDGNGTQDYVLSAVGPYGNGRTAPCFSLIILLMDQDGQPAPFFTVVYKGENGEGIKHLVDLNRDGRAELLIRSYDERPSNPKSGPFCSGHWVNQLYNFNSPAVEEYRGTIGGMKFPMIHNWTDEKCGISESLWRLEPAQLHAHGTSEPGEVRPECRQVDAAVIVFDKPDFREIATPNLHNDLQTAMMGSIRRSRMKVTLRGINDRGRCQVNLLWATH